MENENTCTREEEKNREGKGGKYSKESDEIGTYVCTETPLLDFCKKGRVKSVKINLGRAHYQGNFFKSEKVSKSIWGGGSQGQFGQCQKERVFFPGRSSLFSRNCLLASDMFVNLTRKFNCFEAMIN